jgi:hemolysin D
MNQHWVSLGDGHEVAQAYLGNPPRYLRASIYLLFALLAAAVAWMAMTHAQVHIVARGVVRPKGDLVRVQSIAAGRLLEVRIQEGQRIERGDVLFRVDGRDAQTEIDKNLSLQEAGTRQLTALRSDRTLLLQQQEVEATKDDTALQLASGALDRASMERDQKEATLHEVEARVGDCRRDFDRIAKLQQSDTVSEAELQREKTTLRIAEAARDRSLGELRIAEQEVVLQKQTLALRTQENQIAREQRRRQVSDLDARLAAAEQELRTLILEGEKLRSALDNLDVKASVGGTIAVVDSKNAGEVIRAGDTMASIVPENVPWIVEAYVSNRDAGTLREKLGDAVTLKFDAFPFTHYGVRRARLVQVSTDAVEHEQLGRAYRIEIGLTASEQERRPRAAAIELGMTATVEIVKEEDRILALLFRGMHEAVAGD